jgi:cytochrome c oxidase assembly protein subunit 15
MVHRYLAGVLGLLILLIAVIAWRRRQHPGQQVALPGLILVLVVFQALLGMWTVTLLLKPLVVTAHLLGGITIAALLWWLALRHGGFFSGFSRPLLSLGGRRFGPWILGGIALVYLQIFLGGWTSTNYAALACTDFPLCHGEVIPRLDLKDALTLWHGLGRDYEGGILDTDARVTIHFLHRLGALALLAYLGLLGFFLMSGQHEPRIKRAGAALVLVLFVQIGLGISNVLLGLPLGVAVSHNGGAALLLLTLATVYHIVRPPQVVL